MVTKTLDKALRIGYNRYSRMDLEESIWRVQTENTKGGKHI